MSLRLSRVPTLFFLLFCSIALPTVARAQLNTVFSDIFNEFLVVRLQRAGLPGLHSTHFLEAAANANSELVPALNSLIANNISSFPLSSTSTGLLFDFSSGAPVRVATSLGPIFAETAKPLGSGKVEIEFSYTYLDMGSFRGLQTRQMQFNFTHKKVTPDSIDYLGKSPNESDVIAVTMGLNTRAQIGALTAMVGVTNDLDLGLALPIINISISGTASAVVQSYSYANLGKANHYFGGDSLHPVLTSDYAYKESKTGMGDLALRAKYTFARGGSVDAALLLDIRFPTGKVEDFMGTGKTTTRLWGIVSKRYGDTTPHLNFGYAHKPAELQSDALEFRAGFDNKIFADLTFALDILGQIELNSAEAIHLAPGSVTIYDQPPPGLPFQSGPVPRVVNLSNIPDSNNDNLYSASMGFRFAPSDQVMIYGNVLVPLNKAGLRAAIAPTLGGSVSF